MQLGQIRWCRTIRADISLRVPSEGGNDVPKNAATEGEAFGCKLESG